MKQLEITYAVRPTDEQRIWCDRLLKLVNEKPKGIYCQNPADDHIEVRDNNDGELLATIKEMK